MGKKIIKIGGACGFWGESAMATPQLLATGQLDYIVYDYLAEITMSIMARARAADPQRGYATDFVGTVMRSNIREIDRQGVKIISNAGGVNPAACAEAIRALVKAAGLDLKVAVVSGDDLLGRAEEIADLGPEEMFSGAPFPAPDSIASINAYLGAFPIARALAEGADIVVTGRVVDSAVTLGACIFEFDWRRGDLDRLAGGSLAGHILECGPQATGGNFTDWEAVVDSSFDIGYPIAEVTAEGHFVCTKPEGSGGLVSPHSVGEQMLYEIGDPQAYMLPDVVCDFSSVCLEQSGPDRVKVSGARGYPPPAGYKVSATYADGFRGGQVLFFYGFDADRKAKRFAEVALERARAQLRRNDLADYSKTCVELIGDESHYGDCRAVDGSREVAVKIAVRHADGKGPNVLIREITGLALAAPPGLSGFAGGRPKTSPVIALFSFELDRGLVEASVEMNGKAWALHEAPAAVFDPRALVRPPPPALPESAEDLVAVPLLSLALGRSGDKGDKANIGVIARREEYLPWIWKALTVEAVATTFAHFLEGRVERYYLPGSYSINFVLHEVLGGGGMASLRNDPQGKGYAQLLLNCPVPVPRSMAESR